MLNINNPEFLILFIILPFFVFLKLSVNQKNDGIIKISSVIFISKEIINKGLIKYKIIVFMQALVITLIIFGMARPQLVGNVQETEVEVIDLMMVLDISSSMLADDFKPNRLEVVKRTASEFVKMRQEDRIGLLVFAKESFIQCPLTVDKDVLINLIDEISIVSKQYDGTAIGMAIANAINRLKNKKVENRVMVLLSDGSNNSGEIDPITASDLAAQYNVKIYTIGAGTNKSYTRIPGRGLIKNEIDEETLKTIAEKTGGKFFRAYNEKALEIIYKEIDELEKSKIDIKEYNRYDELYGWFLIPGLIIGIVMEIIRKLVFRSKF